MLLKNLISDLIYGTYMISTRLVSYVLLHNIRKLYIIIKEQIYEIIFNSIHKRMQLFINVSLGRYHVKLSSLNRLYRKPTSSFPIDITKDFQFELFNNWFYIILFLENIELLYIIHIHWYDTFINSLHFNFVSYFNFLNLWLTAPNETKPVN